MKHLHRRCFLCKEVADSHNIIMMKKIGSLLKPGPLNIVAAEWEHGTRRRKPQSKMWKSPGKTAEPVHKVRWEDKEPRNSSEIRWSRYCAHRCKTRTHNCRVGSWGWGQGWQEMTAGEPMYESLGPAELSWGQGRFVSDRLATPIFLKWPLSPEVISKKTCLLLVCLLFYM